jgi:TP901 family phage tail tape measure protein
MAGLEAGTAYVELLPRLSKTFASDVERELKPTLAKIGSKLTNVGADLSRKVTLPLVAGLGVGLVKSDQLAKGIAEVVTLTGEVGPAADKTFGQFKAGVAGLSGELAIAQSTLTDGLYQALSSGVPRDNVFDFLKIAGKAAIGGVTDTETAVDGLSTVLNAFQLPAGEAAAVADSLFTTVKGGKTTFAELSASLFQVAPLANAAGIGFREVNAAMAALTVQGVPTAVATTQVRAAIQGLLKPSEELDKIYKEHGFSSAAEALDKDLAGALNIVAEATNGDIGKLTELVGSIEGVQAILGLTGDNAARFTGELDKQAASVGALDAAFGEVDKRRSLDKLKVAGENFAITLGDTLMPVILDLVNAVTPLLEKFQNLDPAQQRIAAGAVVAVAALGPLLTILGNIAKALSGVAKGADFAAGKLGTLVGTGGKTSPLTLGWQKAAGALETFRLKALYAKDGAANVAKAVASSAANVARSAASMAASAARAAASTVAAVARQVAAWVLVGAQSLLAAGKVALAWVIAMGPIALAIAAVVGVVALIVANWDKIKAATVAVWEAIVGAISAAWEGIKSGVSAAIDFVVGLFMGFLNFYLSIPGRIAAVAATLFVAIYERARDAVQRVKDFIGGIPGAIAGLAGAVGSAALELGKELVGKLVSGISGIVSKAADFGEAIGSAVKKVLNAIIRRLNDAFDFTLKGPGPLPDLHVNLPDLPTFHRGEAAGYVPGSPGENVLGVLKAGERVSTPGQDRRRRGGPLADQIVFNGIDRPRAVVDELAFYLATA